MTTSTRYPQSRPKSRAAAECVKAPTLIRSTPVSAIAHRGQADSARGLQFDGRLDGIAAGDGLSQLGSGHVVEQHDVGPGRQGNVKLVEAIDLDLDRHVVVRSMLPDKLLARATASAGEPFNRAK